MAWWRVAVVAALVLTGMILASIAGTLVVGMTVVKRDVLAYAAPMTGGYDDIILFEPASGHTANLTRYPADDRRPAWSPDGRRLAFRSNRSGGDHIHILEISSGMIFGAMPEEGDRVADDRPAWSSDGEIVLFLRQRLPPAAPPTIYHVSQKGESLGWLDVSHAEAQRYLQIIQPTHFPSPDGEQILTFDLLQDGRWGMFVGPDTNTTGTLIHTLDYDVTPRIAAWSPDGTHIAFATLHGSLRTMYIMRADGSQLYQVGLGDDPAWRR